MKALCRPMYVVLPCVFLGLNILHPSVQYISRGLLNFTCMYLLRLNRYVGLQFCNCICRPILCQKALYLFIVLWFCPFILTWKTNKARNFFNVFSEKIVFLKCLLLDDIMFSCDELIFTEDRPAWCLPILQLRSYKGDVLLKGPPQKYCNFLLNSF
jgi:hypothetical protein